jgi:rod shape-determining protein MreC
MLTEEVNLLKSKLVTLNELSLENARLKSLLGFKQQAPYRLVAARVIGRSPDSWSSSIIIDKGNLQGLRRGMPVITPLGLAGRVVEVATLASRVILVSDPGFGVAAMVERSRQEGLVNGSLKTNLILRYLPADADIKVGDVIITSGLNKACPKGLVIGTVTELISDSSGMSSYATIKPAVNPYNIEEVLIVE